MKKRRVWLFLLAGILVACVVAKDLILKGIVTAVATEVTGAPVHIGWFSLGVARPGVKVERLTLSNPAGFPQEAFLNVPLARVNYDLGAILKGRLHLPLVQLELKELVLVKNKGGANNVDSLKLVQEIKAQKGPPPKVPPMQIDRLMLKIGRIVHKDYSGDKPLVLVYTLNIDKEYRNITTPQQLALVVLSEPLKNAGIKGAAIYGAMAMTGIGLVPAVAAVTLTGQDKAEAMFEGSSEVVYAKALSVLKEQGSVVQEEKPGVIKAKVNASDVTVRLERMAKKSLRVTVSARKHFLPRHELAAGILYSIQETK